MRCLLSRSVSCGSIFFLALSGCAKPPSTGAPPPPPPADVLVSVPVTRQVTDYEDFPGRMEAVNMIEVRARVSGYLDKVLAKDGAEVKKGDVLFQIDSRPYEAELARAEAAIEQAVAHLKRLETDLDRAKGLLGGRAIGREEFDKIAGDRAEAKAAVAVATATRDLARLNLGYTKVTAPIAGRISNRFKDPGNMVKAEETTLTIIVSLDPIYAYFDVDERTTLRLQRLMREGKMHVGDAGTIPVLLGLADEDGYPRQGVIDFADNRVDPETGTWRLRGSFKNTDRMLAPGMFVHIRLPIGNPYSALLIAEQALATDQGQKYVYVVDDKNEVVYRRITVGRLHDGLRVVTSGLAPNEKIIISGLQRVRPKAQVNPTVVPMPIQGSAARAAEAPDRGKNPESRPQGPAKSPVSPQPPSPSKNEKDQGKKANSGEKDL